MPMDILPFPSKAYYSKFNHTIRQTQKFDLLAFKFQKVAIFFTDSPYHVALSEGEERGDDNTKQLGVDSVCGGGGLVIGELSKDKRSGVGG